MNRFLSAGALFVLSTLATPILGQDPAKASAPKLFTPVYGCSLSTLEKPKPSPNPNGKSAKRCGIHPAPVWC